MNNKVVITNNSSKYIFRFKKNLILSLIENGFSVTVISPYDEYSSRFIEFGAAYYPIKIDTNGLNPFKDLILLKDLFQIYKDIKPDYNLLFTIKPNIYGTLISSLLGIKSINNVTGLGSNFIKKGLIQSLIKFLYKYSFNFSTRVMFQNDEDRTLFVEQGLVEMKKTVLIPGSGVDVKRFKPVLADPNLKITFLMIGRVLIDKGVLEYIEAARLIRNKFKNVKFWILGGCDSSSRSSINLETIQSWESEGLVEYLGEVEDVREFISKSDVVVLPSYREGMPRVLLEALAMEIPIIGSDVPGCRHIIKDKMNGYLCKVKDGFDLSLKMEKMILHSHEERKNMGKKGRLEVKKNFDEKIVIQTYIDLLKNL
jgi:glycosyltransferase involved in cell wall biosynthesis